MDIQSKLRFILEGYTIDEIETLPLFESVESIEREINAAKFGLKDANIRLQRAGQYKSDQSRIDDIKKNVEHYEDKIKSLEERLQKAKDYQENNRKD